MTAGLATLKLLTPEVYQQLDTLAENWTKAFGQCFKKHGLEQYTITRYKSLFWQKPTSEKITNVHQIPDDLTTHFDKLFPLLLKNGVYLSPNAYEIGFVSMAHDESILQEFTQRLC